MSTPQSPQAVIDSVTATLTAFLTALSNDGAAITVIIQSGGGGATVNTSALESVVAQIPAAQAVFDALAGNPAPAPAPAFTR
jgi:hypothetical protein